MQTHLISKWLTRGAAAILATTVAAGAQASAPKSCDKLSAADKVVALNDIANLVGRYSHWGTLRGEGTLAELFAMKTQDVSWQTPGGPVGLEAMKARFSRPDEELRPGVLHQHDMTSPVIEIAGDGKTAKGIWGSFGAGINNPNDVGGWLSGKYGVDFIKEDGEWKIWHLRFFALYSTQYDKSVTQTAKERAAKRQQTDRGPDGAGADPGTAAARAQATAAAAGRPAQPPGYVMPTDGWIYDGVSAPKGPRVPVPYCTFDPKDSVAFTGK
jgi:hypothetical protein